MKLTRRALPALALASVARAQGFPDHPLRLVIPFPPGGQIDLIGRLLAQQLAPRLGQPVVVENRAGSGGSIGADFVAKARPDGHTLMIGSNGAMVLNALLQANLPYDPLRDFAPIGLCAQLPMVLVVRADHPAQTVQEFVVMAKAKPGSVSCGTAGNGTSNHLALALFDAACGAGIIHVPYRGTGPMIPDLLAGNVTCLMDQTTSALPLVRDGKARILATTGETRLRVLPAVPTMVECGWPEAVLATFNGLLATAGSPPAALTRLAVLLPECLAEPALRERMEPSGVELATPAQATPGWFAGFLREEVSRMRRAVQLAGLKPE